VLQFDVLELIGRTCLPEYTAPMGIDEEGHKRPRQPMTRREPYAGYRIRWLGSCSKADKHTDRDPEPSSGQDPSLGPGHNPGR
jgi:hypothetical protein